MNVARVLLSLCGVGTLALAGLWAGGCGSDSDGAVPPGCGGDCPDASTADAAGAGGAAQGGSGGVAGGAVGGSGGGAAGGGTGGVAGAGGAGGASGTYKTNLAVCWLDPACHRALVVAHGGDWADAFSRPFLSRPAFDQAVADGADGIEADVRVTLDQVPVVAHSSPIETWESLDCSGQLIEQMTAAEVTQCHLAPSFTEPFQRLDDVLDWAGGKLIMELDVKLAGDLAATIGTILARGAESRTFILVGTGEITSTIPTITGWHSVHYMVDIGDPATEIEPMLAIAASHNLFLFEIDRSYSGYTEAQITDLLVSTVNPGGVKGFSASDQYLATVQNHKDVYHQGFDVVLSYNVPNGVQAAAEINVERGYPP